MPKSSIYEKMNSQNTAFLVIDVVNGCCHKNCEEPKWGITFSKIRRMVPKLNNFLEEYRKYSKGLICFAKIIPWKKEFLTDNINELYTDPRAYCYSDGKTGFSEEFYLLEPKEKEFVFTKNHYDCFTNEDFNGELMKRKIRYVVVAGVFTDGCVLSTIISGFSKRYNFVILKDLIETTDVKDRQDLQEILTRFTFPVMYGKTISSKDFLKAI